MHVKDYISIALCLYVVLPGSDHFIGFKVVLDTVIHIFSSSSQCILDSSGLAALIYLVGFLGFLFLTMVMVLRSNLLVIFSSNSSMCFPCSFFLRKEKNCSPDQGIHAASLFVWLFCNLLMLNYFYSVNHAVWRFLV